jgi:hypothetical protein
VRRLLPVPLLLCVLLVISTGTAAAPLRPRAEAVCEGEREVRRSED